MRKLLMGTLFWLAVAFPSFGATYAFKEVVEVKPQPRAKLVEVWIPVPYQSRWQKVKELKVSSPFDYLLLKEDEYGNRFVYIRHEGPIREPVKVTLEAVVERKELSPTEASCRPPLRYLLSDSLVPVEKFRRLALSITRGKEGEVKKLRSIYDYVVSHMKYDKSGRGW